MGCETCVYKIYPRMPASIPFEADLVIVGEAPGGEEISKKEALIGPPGQLLQKALPACDLPGPDKAFITNALLCRPPKGKPIKKEAVDQCRGRLLKELELAKPKLVLALGNTAMHALTGNYKLKITAEQGRVLDKTLLGNTPVVPAFHPAKILRTPGDYKTFRTALLYAGNILKDGKILSPGEVKYQVINDPKAVPKVIEFLQKLPAYPGKEYAVIATDIETTGLDPRQSQILVMGIAFAKNKVIVLTEKALTNATPLFEMPNVKLIWQGGKFDCSYLGYNGFPAKVDHDTMLLHYCLNETKGTHDLEQLSSQLLGAQSYKAEANQHMTSKKGLAGAPPDVVNRRVAIDADNTYQIFNILLPQVEANPHLKRLYYGILLPAAGFLQRVEDNGLPVDLEALHILHDEFTLKFQQGKDEIAVMVEDLWDVDDYVTETDAKTAPKQFSPTSTKQLAWLLFDRLRLPMMRKKGRSTDKDVLEYLLEQPAAKRVVPLLKKLQVLRGVQKDLSTYIKGIQKRLSIDNRVHTTFLLHGTVTGRLSSRNPNLQNFSKKRPEVRRIIRAPEGRVFIEADYKGAELRVMAHLSKDEFLTQVFKDGRDLHSEVAIEFFGTRFTHEDRMKAKTINFGVPYGRTKWSVAEELGISVEEADDLIQKWFRRAPGATAYLQQQADDAAAGKVLITPFGRHRRFGLVTRDILGELQNEARNFRISSMSSDFTLISGMRLEFKLKPLNTLILNLVHDSILCECDDNPETIRESCRLIAAEMRQVPIDTVKAEIPFEVEIKIGKTWDALKEYNFE